MRPILLWSSLDNGFLLLVIVYVHVSMLKPTTFRSAEQMRQNPLSSMIKIFFLLAGITKYD